MEIHQPQSSFVCPTCGQSFENSQNHKLHYKSDFHRYNLKRKMVKLPPVTQLQFSTKIHQAKVQQNQEMKCNQCGKKFGSINTLNQHAQSKGHNPVKVVQKAQYVQRKPLPFMKNAKKCLFCDDEFRTIELNERHMETKHTFFLPQKQFCINVKGLIEYLQEKIEVGVICILCNNKKTKDFQTGDALKKHMIDKGHTFMKTDNGFQEYENFYDFSALFDLKLEQQGRDVPGIEYQEIKVIVDRADEQNIDEDDEEWEDEQESEDNSDWQSCGEGEEDDRIAKKQQQAKEKEVKEIQIVEKKKIKVKTYHIMKPTITSNEELLLPNGKVLGHRKYRYLYRQSYKTPNFFLNNLKQIAYGQAPQALVDRRQLFKLVRQEKAYQRNLMRGKKLHVKTGMNNNGLQKHFRIQNSM